MVPNQLNQHFLYAFCHICTFSENVILFSFVNTLTFKIYQGCVQLNNRHVSLNNDKKSKVLLAAPVVEKKKIKIFLDAIFCAKITEANLFIRLLSISLKSTWFLTFFHHCSTHHTYFFFLLFEEQWSLHSSLPELSKLL